MSRLKTDAIRNVNASVDGITLDTSGNVAIPNELQLADKIVHTGDTNTFIRFPAADTVSVETAGSEALRIDSSQRVMIGSTVSGGWKLRVQVPANASYQGAFNITNNVNADINFEIKNSESRIGPSTHTPLTFKNAGGDRLQITSDGSISYRTGGGKGYGFNSSGSSAGVANMFAPASYTVAFGTNNSERLRIDSSGNVGIGLTNPDDFYMKQLVVNCPTEGGITINRGANTGANYLAFAEEASGGEERYRGFIGYSHNATAANGYMNLAANGSTRMQVLGNGNVKINDGNLIINTAGHGIDFSATSDTSGKTSELLDDYEEGTWTQTAVNLGDHNKHGDSHANYTKIGNLVTASFFYKWTSRSTNNGAYGVKVSMPFTAATLVIPGTGSCACESIGLNNSDRTSFHTSIYSNTNLATFRASKHNDSEISFNGAISTSASAGYFAGTVSYLVP